MLPGTGPERSAVWASRPMPSCRLSVRRCDPLRESAPLALAAQGWDEAERAQLWKSVRQTALRDALRVVLLAAEQGDSLVAAQIALVLPGRAALAWPIQWPHASAASAGIDDTLHLIKNFENTLIHALADGGCVFAQAVVSPSDDRAAQLLADEGFVRMTQLVYLVDALGQNPAPDPAAKLSWLEFQPQAESRLAHLLQRTYVDTRDCPWLDRLRTPTDVLAGYRAVGRFDPALWQIAQDGGEDVGCVLVNVHPDVQHAELIYLGLVPEARGRGWGRELVDCARRLAWQAGCRRMVLAVDDANEPAKRLYARCGMVEFARRELWVHTVSRREEKP